MTIPNSIYFPFSRLSPTNHTDKVKGKLNKLGIKSGKPNCGIVSMAYITDKPVSDMAELYRKRYYTGKGWRGRTNNSNRFILLRNLGVNCVHVKFKSKTLMTWFKNEADKTKVYEVTTTSHAMVYDKGVMIDQCGIVTDYALTSRARLDTIIEII